jgi:hypothetical protein
MSAEVSKPAADVSGSLERDGFCLVRRFVLAGECDSIANVLTPLFDAQQQLAANKIGGLRNLLCSSPIVQQFSNAPGVMSLLRAATGLKPFPVRAIFFDKNPKANWLVPWHQDLAIAVTERIEVQGFTGWSVKEGVLHVHPPTEILENMITIRLHLDDCGNENGPLKLIPGSHRAGKLAAPEIRRVVKSTGAVTCEISKGDLLLMRPLILHASSAATQPSHRRVLHVEYAAGKLPNGLSWTLN